MKWNFDSQPLSNVKEICLITLQPCVLNHNTMDLKHRITLFPNKERGFYLYSVHMGDILVAHSSHLVTDCHFY